MATTRGVEINPYGGLTDVPGVWVGHANLAGPGALTGTTVVVPPVGTVGAVDVSGGGPATHETDALDPTTLVPTVDAVVLTGGSAYGLASAHGVQRWCEERGRGFAVGSDPSHVVPIVPAAALFDLGRGGDFAARPNAGTGYAAAIDAQSRGDGAPVATGCVGAGCGAKAGGLKGGVGTASLRLPGGLVVGALVALNCVGSPVDATTGALLASSLLASSLLMDARMAPRTPDPAEHRSALQQLATASQGHLAGRSALNTTLVVVACNARLDPARTRRTASAAHAGIARAVRPSHTLLDGDTVFALSTQELEVPPDHLVELQSAAADSVSLAILDAVLAATGVHTPSLEAPSYLELYPSARSRP